MRTLPRLRRAAPVVVALALLPSPAAAQASAPPSGTAALGWLAGCWERRDGATLVEEQWSAPRGGTMLGTARTTRGDTLREWETTRLYDAPDGALVYAANPSGQTPTEFRMARPATATPATWSALAFENRAHDFPQVIRYRAVGRDSLLAQIEGPRGGQTRTVDYPMRRVPCPGAAAAAASAAATSTPAARAADVASVDAILAALYDVISGPAGQKRDWDRMRSLFAPGARLIPTGRTADGSFRQRTWTVEEYIANAGVGLETNGFFEREIGRRTETYGNIVHAFSAYDSRRTAADPQPFARGINSIQLWNDGTRWWVVTVFWEGERPDNPIPAQYIGTPK
ncbi:DUF6265 family protein [Roseisolibacter agri]|uniref:DUF6265 domain-containing protein n=1 Tax=Roseisolibacter agri TaxID=2014610 RepID=A0AA37Q179_9BACT|nr:DUF6265 family protein [Roseisolibacter agri]GLC24725.1 hypothetical protein rosag_12380 [Roseisolibacter agri]